MLLYEEEDILEERKEFLPQEFVEDEGKKDILLDVIKSLPFHCKMCMMMFYYEGMSYKDISEVLDISKKDVDNNMVKAKKLIRKKLEKRMSSRTFSRYTLSVAPIPVLTQVLKLGVENSNIAVASDRVLKMVTAAGSGIGGAAQAAANVKKNTSTTIVKTIAGVSTVIGIAAGGIVGYNYLNNPKQEAPQMPEVQEVQEVQEEAEDLPMEQEAVIQVLDDMLGVTQANVLRTFAQSDEVVIEELEHFFLENSLECREELYREQTQEIYSLYYLTKQEKQLIVIVKEDGGAGVRTLKYVFNNLSEPIPESIEIMICFEEW